MNENVTYLRSLRIIHIALTAGQIIFLLIAMGLLVIRETEGEGFPSELLLPFAFGLTLLCIGGGYLFFRLKLKKIRELQTLNEKLKSYRSLIIIRYAFFEAPALFCILFLIVSGSYLFACVAFASILHFMIHRPGSQRLIRHLDLDYKEQFELEKP